MNQKYKSILIALLIVVFSSLATNEIHKTVAIVIDKEVTTTTLWGFTVADALSAAQIPIYQGDLIDPGMDQRIKENQMIQIQRAAWVIIVDGEDEYTLWTAERQPGKLMKAVGVKLQSTDKVYLNEKELDSSQDLSYSPITTLKVVHSTPIRLEDNKNLQRISSYGNTLMDALWEAGIGLYSSDDLQPDPQTQLEGIEIRAVLERSKEVTITYKGKEIKTRVLGGTIGDALNQARVPLQEMDYSIPPEDSPIPANGKFRVIKVREEYILEQEFIPFGIEYIPSQEINLDTLQVLQTGEYGLLAKRVRVLYEDDEEISRTVGETWTAKEPKPRQVGYGTKVTIQTVNTPQGPVQYYREVDAYATSYSPCRIGIAGKCSSTTASGAELKNGVIGVIRSWYNYMKGARVYIPGYGFATIEDIGAGFSDRHWVDLGYSDQDWVSWSRYVTVYFLTPVPTNILYILN